ncbi:MAG: quinone oxidoreductase [Rhodospirillaceae bacterium]|nr:quinone oxidoreductase [Rhodospirillaceae bacterium]MCA8931334.1 quinone oxidoreductase [Rhodospirillaceae bacterium]
MTKAIRIHETGGPDAMVWEDVEVGDPGPGEIRVRHTFVGLNYIDTYHRNGLYPLPLPTGLGLEAAGVVEAVGAGVHDLKVGERVAYGVGPIGAYAEARVMPADRVVALPDAIDDKTAAAMMLQGMTVEYLLCRTYPVQPGQTILFHAAAGGVGLIACQWARHLGVTVIGTVGSEEKAELARAHGATHVINYRTDNFVERVRQITNGAGVPVVYDGVGADTWDGSLDCLSPRGMMVSFGNASGAVPPFSPGVLAQKGSLYLTRPVLMTYTASRQDLVASAAALFEVIVNGAVEIPVNQVYPLAEAAQAHRDLEARKTTGSTVFSVGG